jgi:hypothetical protein
MKNVLAPSGSTLLLAIVLQFFFTELLAQRKLLVQGL